MAKWRKFHELSPWDERTIFRLREGKKLQGPPEEMQRILAEFKSAPRAPKITVELHDGIVAIHPVEPCGQLELGAVAAGLRNFTITNPIDRIDLRLPFRLHALIGSDAFTKPNSWRLRRWQVPLEVARMGQRNTLAWDKWYELLAGRIGEVLTIGKLADSAYTATAATLEGRELTDFWRANR